jgi:isopentenyl diphosphate isomerase/L-lactate dehydrogenase-like FMN-dependent dehydrogenase
VVGNHEAFAHYEIRARRFADLRRLDSSRKVYGATWATPAIMRQAGTPTLADITNASVVRSAG